jgi:hypothetical protein
VGNGEQVKLGANPWVCCKNMVRFTEEMVELLHDQGITYTLNQVANQATTNLWQQGWENVQSLGLEGENEVL